METNELVSKTSKKKTKKLAYASSKANTKKKMPTQTRRRRRIQESNARINNKRAS